MSLVLEIKLSLSYLILFQEYMNPPDVNFADSGICHKDSVLSFLGKKMSNTLVKILSSIIITIIHVVEDRGFRNTITV